MKTEESIFRVGDKVYDYRLGWGEILDTDLAYKGQHPIKVKFDNDIETYTLGGRYNLMDKSPTLSFTEYEIVKNGFSQVRPQPEIAVDTPIFVKRSNRNWHIRYFSHFNENGKMCCFIHQLKSTQTTDTTAWTEYSLENPLL